MITLLRAVACPLVAALVFMLPVQAVVAAPAAKDSPPAREEGTTGRTPLALAQLRAQAQTELTNQRAYAASLETLARALRALQNSIKTHRAESDKENSDIVASITEWDKASGATELEKLQRALNAAQMKLNARTAKYAPGSSAFFDTTNFLDFLPYVHGGLQGTTNDIQGYIALIDISKLEADFGRAVQQATSAVQTIKEKRVADPCFDFVQHTTTGRFYGPAGDTAYLNEANTKAAECKADGTQRAEFYKTYYEAMASGVSRLLEIIGAANATARTNIETAAERLRSLSEEELRADAQYSQRAKTTIDDSARWIILITLVAWLMIIAIVVGAIIIMGGKYNPASAGGTTQPFNYALFLEMMTVFILTATILILGLAAKLDNAALAALIGGISGYVLGRIHSSGRPVA